MSQHSRRTHTQGESSSSNTRLSRIAQPIRRPSLRERSLERASSTDQINNTAYTTTSAVKRNRTSATPMRTPNRPIPHPGVGIIMTTEKERMPLEDKKALQAQATRVNEYLHEIEDILGKDSLNRGGLKSMSTKQFVVIFSHLLKFIAGNRLSIGTNYVEDIVEVLAEIEYPYTINKSWLKTPSAPHAFNNVVVLFGWMLDFVPKFNCDDFENEFLIVPENLPDREYALKFITSAKEGFSLWNNSKNEEFNNLKKELTDLFIQKRGQADSLSDLVAHILELCSEIKALHRNKSKSKAEKELTLSKEECQKLEDEVKLKQMRVVELERVCEENQRSVTRLSELSQAKQQQVAEAQERVALAELNLQNQKMSMAERANLISRVHYLRQLLDSKRKAVFLLQDTDAGNQVLYSRLIKQTIDAVTEFNTNLQRILNEQTELDEVDIESICFDQNGEFTLEDQIDRIVPTLERIKQSAVSKIQNNIRETAELEHDLKMAICEHDNLLDEQLENTTSKCLELAANVKKYDMDILNAKNNSSKDGEQLLCVLEQQTIQNASIRKKLTSLEEEVNSVKIENADIEQLVNEKLEAYLQAKTRNVNLLDDAVKQLWMKLEEITLKLKEF